MTKDELLKRRWKVIADYPKNPYKVGHIIQSEFGWITDYVKPYPHLFRELHWSEDREILDLPEYVKGIGGYFKDKIFKIAPPSQNGRKWHIDNEIEHQTFLRWATAFMPSDESEYNDYINSKIK